ncbi:MAG: hypothetical protein WBA10_15015 [Elainellaceae cyanobacterium]
MQDQINSLSVKLDVLQGAVEQLDARVSDTLTALSLQPVHQAPIAVSVPEEARNPRAVYSKTTPRPHHKDILADNAYVDIDSSYAEGTLSPEVQTQRLMAQLTAAYNRIAALEEQLLDCRIKS